MTARKSDEAWRDVMLCAKPLQEYRLCKVNRYSGMSLYRQRSVRAEAALLAEGRGV